jgi:homoserine O-acetyltransferase
MPLFSLNNTLTLENQQTLNGVEVTYHTYGHFNPGVSRVIWICHALTANSEAHVWWNGLVGKNKTLDTVNDFIVCANVLGSCYGTTGPLSIHSATGQPYYHSFPSFTIRDMVQLHMALADHLGIEEIDLLIGGSLGGQQALEWSIIEPHRIKSLVLVATNAVHSAWGKAFNESQRMAIEMDTTWKENSDKAGSNGLQVARSIALLSYRNYVAYHQTDHEEVNRSPFTYQRYQGEKLAARFNAFSYYRLSQAMDSHDVGRGRGGFSAALRSIKARTLVIGIEGDLLFPNAEQAVLARYIPGARLSIIRSEYGHDGFLIEGHSIGHAIKTQLQFKPNIHSVESSITEKLCLTL